MDPLLHLLSLEMPRTFVDSPELARRREMLRDPGREPDRDARFPKVHRRRTRVRTAVAVVTAGRRP